MQSTHVLLLLHAFPLGRRMWEPQLEAFPGWRLIAPSFPGFDGTPRAAAASMDAYAAAALAALDAAGVERAVVAGVSMGGYGAFALLRRAPERVAGLILADTRSTADSEQARAGRQAMLQSLVREGVDAVARDMLPKLLGETTQRQRPAVVARVRSLILSQDAAAIADAVKAMMARPDSTPHLAAVQAPTLVLVGTEDVVTPPPEAAQLQQQIPAATLVELEGAGHLSNLEQPARFNDAVLRFLRTLRSL